MSRDPLNVLTGVALGVAFGLALLLLAEIDAALRDQERSAAAYCAHTDTP